MIKVMLLCSTEATTPTQSLQFNKQSGHRRPTLNSVQRGQMRAVVPPLLSQPCTKHPLLHSTGKDTYPTICLRRYHVHGLTTGTQSAVADDLRKCFFVLVSSHLLSACVWCMCILMRMMYVCMHIDVCVCQSGVGVRKQLRVLVLTFHLVSETEALLFSVAWRTSPAPFTSVFFFYKDKKKFFYSDLFSNILIILSL